jgi:hypothetical protein
MHACALKVTARLAWSLMHSGAASKAEDRFFVSGYGGVCPSKVYDGNASIRRYFNNNSFPTYTGYDAYLVCNHTLQSVEVTGVRRGGPHLVHHWSLARCCS